MGTSSVLRLLLAVATLLPMAAGQEPSPVTGAVTDPTGQPLEGVLVTIQAPGSGTAVTVTTRADGSFHVRPFVDGPQTLRAGRPDLVPIERQVDPGDAVRLTLQRADSVRRTAAALLHLLPDGEPKRQFILDCTGCHQFDAQTIMAEDRSRLKNRGEWQDRITQMIQFAGAQSGFPIMSAARDAQATSAWLAGHLGDGVSFSPTTVGPTFPSVAATVTEYAMPVPQDLPHDLVVGPDGAIVITGMMTHRMYVLDPATGAFTSDSIPVPFANPRAVEIAPDGTWWVLLGFPRKVARRDPAGRWSVWDIGMYPHSIGLGRDGLVWFNGHFTHDPEQLGSLDPATGTVTTYEVPTPAMADGGSTIPYELRIDANGRVWVSQLAGGRLVRFDPADRSFALRSLPTPASGPRRFDIDEDGVLWIPAYADNRLIRYDPRTDQLDAWELPIPDALPYVARVDSRRAVIWIGTGAADALVRFEPATGRFAVVVLPTPGALVRHLDVDRASGDVWLAYGASPSRMPANVARVRVEPP